MQPNNSLANPDFSSSLYPNRTKPVASDPNIPPVHAKPTAGPSEIPTLVSNPVPVEAPRLSTSGPLSEQASTSPQTQSAPFCAAGLQPTPPPAPSNTFDASRQAPPLTFAPKRSSSKIIPIIVVILIIIGAGATLAYFAVANIFNKPPYDDNKLASSILAGIGKIKTSAYSLNVNIAGQPLEADAKPWSSNGAMDAYRVEAYKRDQDRARDTQDLLTKLRDYYYKNKSYPASLSGLGDGSFALNKDYVYMSIKYQSDFSLAVTFETSAAIDAINASLKYATAGSVTVKGKVVTYNKSSSSYLSLPSTMKQPGFIDISGLQSSLSYIPSNFKFDGTLSGASQKIDNKTINGQARVTATTDLSDINVNVDFEFKKVADDFYFIVHKFPIFFIDISKLKEKWIKVTSKDMATYGSSYISIDQNNSQDELDKIKERSTEQVKLFISIADKDNAFVVRGTPVKDTVEGATAYRYELGFNKANLVKFYTDITTEFKDKYADKNPLAFDQATLDYLKSPAFDAVYDYIVSNTSMTLWANADGIPLQFKYSLRVVPDAKSGAPDHEIKLVATLTLHDLNKSTSITTPSDFMTLEDATITLTGQSKEQYRFSKQTSVISKIRYALDSYKQAKKVYPKSLEDLRTATSSYSNTALLKAIPVDVYDNSAFVYVNNGSDYALTYNIQLPAYIAGDSVRSMLDYDYSDNNGGRSVVIKAVNGRNTANSKHVSAEAYSQSQKDTDGDKLPDVIEKYIGTNINKKDSDGDSHSDYDEVMGGTNPLGPGSLKSSGMFGF